MESNAAPRFLAALAAVVSVVSLAGCRLRLNQPPDEGAGASSGAAAHGGVPSDTLGLGAGEPAAQSPGAPAGAPGTSPRGTGETLPDLPGGVAVDLRCQADPSLPQQTDYAQPGPFAVGLATLTLDDTSRPIAATDRHAAAPSRALVTNIHYPASGVAPLIGPAPVASGGPFPLLMYSHGYSSGKGEAQAVANHAASHGYIVVAPDFPLTHLLANGGAPDVTDVANQPGDVSFLIDRVLGFSEQSDHLLAGAVDATRIGALGVSLGGLTTLLLAFHPTLRDPRVGAAMPIAAVSSFFAEGFYHTRELPLLFVHGDLDAFVDYELNARRAFERASPNARLVSIARGSHAAFGAAFDASLLPALNGWLAPPGADPSNPDGLGCGAVGDTLSNTGPDFLTALGGAENFIEPEAALLPCQGDEYTQPALDPAAQEAILVRSVVPFFDAHLAATPEKRQDGCRYLLQELPRDPAVTLE